VTAETALRSRDALESLLRAHGLAAHAAWLAHEVARFGLRILPGSGRERSTLGGPALLPVGQRWPQTDSGRPLVCLAVIELSDLPGYEERHRWPAGGRLLFYADIELDEIEGLYLEYAENAENERARV
jgi:hypothetical protein